MTKQEFMIEFVLRYAQNGQFLDNPHLVKYAESQWNQLEEAARKDRGDHYA